MHILLEKLSKNLFAQKSKNHYEDIKASVLKMTAWNNESNETTEAT